MRLKWNCFNNKVYCINCCPIDTLFQYSLLLVLTIILPGKQCYFLFTDEINSYTYSPSLLQGIFPTQGSNPGLLHCRQILYHLSHQGSSAFLQRRSTTTHIPPPLLLFTWWQAIVECITRKLPPWPALLLSHIGPISFSVLNSLCIYCFFLRKQDTENQSLD